jgi:hypothetical protein
MGLRVTPQAESRQARDRFQEFLRLDRVRGELSISLARRTLEVVALDAALSSKALRNNSLQINRLQDTDRVSHDRTRLRD